MQKEIFDFIFIYFTENALLILFQESRILDTMKLSLIVEHFSMFYKNVILDNGLEVHPYDSRT